jgi:hypothetical protein
MRGIILAWLIGEGVIVYRSVNKNHAPPVPGTLLATSGLFALLALLAEYQPARFAATALAFGVDIAALMNLWSLGGGSSEPVSSANMPVAPRSEGGT